MMPKPKAPGAGDSFQDSRLFTVPFPSAGFDAFGSEVYKRFLDDGAVRAKMLGWELTTDGLSIPASVRESVEARANEPMETHANEAPVREKEAPMPQTLPTERLDGRVAR